jgi:hypothetical protein
VELDRVRVEDVVPGAKPSSSASDPVACEKTSPSVEETWSDVVGAAPEATPSGDSRVSGNSSSKRLIIP